MSAGKSWPFGLAALVLVLAVHGGTLRNDFVFDDHKLVEANPVVRTLNPVTHLSSSFWSRWEMGSDYWRPVVTMSLALDRAVWGEAPWGFHLTNLLLHAAAVFLLFLLLRGLGGTLPAAVGAALFAVHPVQVESVAFVLGRTDLLAVVFLLLAALAYRAGRHLAALAAFAGALLSKESAVTFPALALGIELARSGGTSWSGALADRLGPFLRRIAPYLALVAVYLLLRYAVLGVLLGTPATPEVSWRNPVVGAPLGARWLTAVDVAARYVLLVLFPLTLSVEYGHDVVPLLRSAASPSFLVSAGVVLAALGAVAWLARRSPLGRFGAAAAAGSYLLMSHLLFPAPIIMAERVLYLPLVGVAALAAAAASGVASRLGGERGRRAVIAAAVLLAVPLAARSFARVADWRDDLTLYEATTRDAPRAALAWNNLGVERTRRRDFDGALSALQRAVEIYPGYVAARVNRAVALRDRGDLAAAERELRETIRDVPGSDDVRIMLVTVLGMRAEELAGRRREDEAAALRREVVELGTRVADDKARAGRPGLEANLRVTVAQNLALLGRDTEAAEAFDLAIAAAERELESAGSVPEVDHAVHAGALGASAWFLERSGQPREAAERYEAAREAAERAGDAALATRMQLEVARVWLDAGRGDAALAALDVAERLGAGEPAVARELDATRVRAAEAALAGGTADRAVALYDAVLARDEGNVRARHGRARGRLALDDAAGAALDLERLVAGELPPRLAAAVRTDLAGVALARGDGAAALGQLDLALKADGSYVEARFRRGVLRAELGDAAGAESDLRATLEAGLPPGAAAEAWFRLARLAADRGDRAGAREHLRRCLGLDPKHAGARELRARLGG